MSKKSVLLSIAIVVIIGCVWIFNGLHLEKIEKDQIDEIVVGLDAQNVSYAPLIVAEKNGYFAEQQLKVDLLYHENAEAVTNQLMDGNVDVSISDTKTALESDKEGASPVVIGTMIAKDGVINADCKETCISTSQSVITTTSQKVQRFMNALCKAQDYVIRHASSKTAKIIQEEFPNLTIEKLASMIQAYKEEGIFSKDNIVPVSSTGTNAASRINNDYVKIYRGIDIEEIRDRNAM